MSDRDPITPTLSTASSRNRRGEGTGTPSSATRGPGAPAGTALPVPVRLVAVGRWPPVAVRRRRPDRHPRSRACRCRRRAGRARGLRGDWGGTAVDLRTGARTPVYGESEIWYDRDRGLVHDITRLGGAVGHESVSHPTTEAPPELAALASDYRDALEQGTARVAEEGSVGGEQVYWIVYRQQLLPDWADGRNHEFSDR